MVLSTLSYAVADGPYGARLNDLLTAFYEHKKP